MTIFLKKLKDFLFLYRLHLFPFVLLCIVLILTSLQISGSSIGIYHDYLYGKNSKDSDLIYGKPQSIRSDEWLVATQMVIAQVENGQHQRNYNFNGGEDMSIVLDSPYREWSSIFKPQNFSFFVLPIEYAFAFKWWFIIASLLISAYYFILKITRNKVAVAIFASITISLSPFVFWWYHSAVVLTLAYAFMIMIMSISILDKSSVKLFRKELSPRLSITVKVALLSYILSCFALILYPPFQIPVVIVVLFFMLGYLFNLRHKKSHTSLFFVILPFLITGMITGVICASYLVSRSSVVETISNTAYPGKRDVASGGYDIKMLLANYLQPKLQDSETGSKFYLNQSESSNYILLPLFFILPALYLLITIRLKKGRFEWVLFFLLLCSLLFFSHLFVNGLPNYITHAFLLHLVPQKRLIVGLGLLAIILVVYMIRLIDDLQIKFSKKNLVLILIYTILFFGAALWAGFEIRNEYPDFITSKKTLVLLALIVVSAMSLILLNKPRIGLLILALFSFYSIHQIQPLYRGLGPIYDNKLVHTIKSISKPGDTWASANDLYIENLPQISNRHAVTGVAAYPDLGFWSKYSPDKLTYNRFAHIVLSGTPNSTVNLVQADYFTVSASCNQKLVRKINYIVSTQVLEGTCRELIKTIRYPQQVFYFYKVLN